MEIQYNLDSDSEDEEEISKPVSSTKRPNVGGTVAQIHDIEKLKAQTAELLDPTWKEVRNKNLIHKMLELEDPTITPKMVDFLLQDGVIESLMGFITQTGTHMPRPSPTDNKSDQLKWAYKAVMLLTPDDPTEALIAILSKKSALISKLIFDIFRDDSAGSFYHAYRILDTLLRCFPADVYDGICSEGRASARIGSMLRYIGYPPVNEIFVVLVALTSIGRNSQLYLSCQRQRFIFFEHLSDWIMISRIADIVVSPSEFCSIDSYVSAENHSTAAALLLQDLTEKLSLEEPGEVLIQPLGTRTSILDRFVDAAVDPSCQVTIRRSACKILCFLLRRAAEPEVICMVNTGAGTPPQQTIIPNRLYPLRESIVLHIETRLPEVFDSILKFQELNEELVKSSIKYSSYAIKAPFTSLRTSLIELMVLMVESDEAVASTIPIDLWKDMMSWTITYAYNSIYHALFYRLVFATLRQNQESAQRVLFQKAKLATFLIENYIPYPIDSKDAPNPRTAPEIDKLRSAARGLLLNSLNAIRLQAVSSPPESFLRQFLMSHHKWNEFEAILINDTDLQQHFGMGIKVSDYKSATNANNITTLSQIVFEPKPEDSGIDHGSRFARSLGFYEETGWVGDSDFDVGAALARANRKKKKSKAKKNRRKSKNADTMSEDDFSSTGEPEELTAGDDVDEDGDADEDDDDFAEDAN